MVKITIKIYVDKYDTQGTPMEIDTDTIVTKEDWERTKQKAINEFIKDFNIGNIKVKGKAISYWLRKDFYKDNKLNRKLKRVGNTYQGKGTNLVNTIKDKIRNRNFQIQGEHNIIQHLTQPQELIQVSPQLQFKKRKWMDKETEMLRTLREKNLTYKQIGLRLYRTESSVGSKWRRLK